MMFTEVTTAQRETRSKAHGYRMCAEGRGRRLLATPKLGHTQYSWINTPTRLHGFTAHRNRDVEIILRARKLSVAYRSIYWCYIITALSIVPLYRAIPHCLLQLRLSCWDSWLT